MKDLPVERFRLNNGLEVFLQPDRRLPLIAACTSYAAGSRYDPPHCNGLAHLCEHAAADRGSVRIEEAGGALSAATGCDAARFTILLPADARQLLWDTESARMSGLPNMEADALERHRGVLLQEIRQRLSWPRLRYAKLLQENLYQAGHPYHLLPQGSSETIRRIALQDVARFFDDRYRSRGAVLAMAGDFCVDTALVEIEHAFRGGGNTADEAVAGPSNRNNHALSELTIVEERAVSADVYLALPAPGRGQPEWNTAALFVRALALGQSSPLHRDVVGGGIAHSLEAGLLSMHEESAIILRASASLETGSAALRSEFLDAFDRRLDHGVSEDDVRRARAKTLTDHYTSLQRLAFRSETLAAGGHLNGIPEQLTASQLSAFGRDLRSARRVILRVSGPCETTYVNAISR